MGEAFELIEKLLKGYLDKDGVLYSEASNEIQDLVADRERLEDVLNGGWIELQWFGFEDGKKVLKTKIIDTRENLDDLLNDSKRIGKQDENQE